MAGGESGKVPDPLGKRALYGPPPLAATRGRGSPADGPLTEALPVGKRALYSERSQASDVRDVDGNPLAARGSFTVQCQRCRQVSHVGLLDVLIFQFPIGVWLPRGRFDHRMTCPSCRKRSWCSVTLRRD
jgi:hypothetical protein